MIMMFRKITLRVEQDISNFSGIVSVLEGHLISLIMSCILYFNICLSENNRDSSSLLVEILLFKPQR